MRKLTFALGLLLFFSSCYNDKYDKLYPAPVVVVCDTTTVTYANDIQPIITANCAIAGGCHDATGVATSGFDFSSYSILLKIQATNGNLIGDLTSAAGHNPMPKNGSPLSSCDIDKFTRWVNQGAQNN